MKCRPLLAPSIINRVTKSRLKRRVGGLWSISQGSGVKSPKSSETSWHWICSKCWWMWMCSTIMSNILSRLVVRWRFKQTEGSREGERDGREKGRTAILWSTFHRSAANTEFITYFRCQQKGVGQDLHFSIDGNLWQFYPLHAALLTFPIHHWTT